MRSNRFTFAMVSLAALSGIKSKKIKPQTLHIQTKKQMKKQTKKMQTEECTDSCVFNPAYKCLI